MQNLLKIKKISIWIFIIPFFALNACLILITNFQQFFAPQDIIHNTIPYIDGGASISRTARVFPTYLIFKPAMFITSFLLIQYWRYNFSFMKTVNSKLNYGKFFVFFGIGSAIFLVLHSIFLGIKFDNDLYKFSRRVIILFFIIFELVAQTLLVFNLYKVKDQIKKLINDRILICKIVLVSILIIVAIVSLPIMISPGHIFIKHALEWNYFVGIITFYLLTFFFWKKN